MTTPTETPTAAPQPKYRYSTVLPDTLLLSIEDLVAFLPEGAWRGRLSDKQRTIILPTAAILETNYPRIRFSRLCELLPACVQPLPDAPEWIPLPTDRVALAYKIQTRRELLPELPSETPSPISPAGSISAQSLEKPNPEPASEAPLPSWKKLPKPELAPPPPEKTSLPDPQIDSAKPPPAFAETLVAAGKEPRLKDFFQANETLSVEKIVERCQAQSGVKACLLSRGADKVKAGDLPASLETGSSVGGLLAAARKFGEAAGLPLKQALTVYTESGSLSFLRHHGLVLAVLHEEGGLSTALRSKFKLLLQAIDRATTN